MVQLTSSPLDTSTDMAADLPQSIDMTVYANPVRVYVQWSATKSIWWSLMTIVWLIFAPSTISISSIIVFTALTAITLCAGHSIGMHRKLIHHAFDCPKWLERLFVYLSTLVGLGGPFTMMRTHDTRDWAQRLPECHSFLSHQNSFFKDFIWQLHCKLHLTHPPRLRFDKTIESDLFYQILQRTSILQQGLLAIVLFHFGGWSWVVWGVCARVSVSIFGHWLVGYFAHNSGHRSWYIKGAAVQGYNVTGFGLLTFGECWHNNHHAFPGSAKLGVFSNQVDPGWEVLKVLRALRLVWNLKTPEDLPYRHRLAQLPK